MQAINNTVLSEVFKDSETPNVTMGDLFTLPETVSQRSFGSDMARPGYIETIVTDASHNAHVVIRTREKRPGMFLIYFNQYWLIIRAPQAESSLS